MTGSLVLAQAAASFFGFRLAAATKNWALIRTPPVQIASTTSSNKSPNGRWNYHFSKTVDTHGSSELASFLDLPHHYVAYHLRHLPPTSSTSRAYPFETWRVRLGSATQSTRNSSRVHLYSCLRLAKSNRSAGHSSLTTPKNQQHDTQITVCSETFSHTTSLVQPHHIRCACH